MTKKKGLDVCMIVHNSLTYDTRVLREAASITRNGLSVVILAITPNEHHLPVVEVLKGFTIRRISLPVSYRQLASSVHNCIEILAKQQFASQNSKQNNQGVWRRLKLAPQRLISEILSSVYRLVLSDESVVAMFIVVLQGMYCMWSVKARIYHAHDFSGLLHVAIAGIWNRPIIYDSHELFFDQWYPNDPPRIYRNLRSWEKFLARRASAILTVGETIADRLVETLKVKPPTIIFNAVDLRFLEPSEVTYNTSGRRTIVHSGALNFGRHLPELLTSLLYLPEDVVIVLMGDGVLKESLEMQAKELCVTDRVIFVPPVLPNSIASTLAQADIGAVLITNQNIHYDCSMPNKLFECVAAGLPLIVSHCREISDLIRKYELGIVCNPMHPEEIAAGVLELLEPSNLLRYKHNACAARDSFLNWENEEIKLMDVYQNILANNSSKSKQSGN